MTDPLRFAVLGPGGVGGMLGALLGRAGHRVTCVAPESTAAAIRSQGLTLSSAVFGDAHVQVDATTELEQPVDVCLVTVKATNLEAALHRVPPQSLDGGLVVPFLNGIDHVARLREVYPPDQVVAGTIRVEAARVRPGRVEHLSPFAMVELAYGLAERARVDGLAGALGATGLDVTVSADEATVLWSKLAVLAPIALLTTATLAPFGEAMARRGGDLGPVVNEIVGAARGDGVSLDPAAIMTVLGQVPAGLRSSMQKDAIAGRPIELDAIGGSIVRAARRAGVATPVTSRLMAELAVLG